MAFHPAMTVAIAAFAVAGYGSWAEVRRARRNNFDAVGFMPWRDIVFAALFLAVIASAMAFKGD